jgi:hypothetical protein
MLSEEEKKFWLEKFLAVVDEEDEKKFIEETEALSPEDDEELSELLFQIFKTESSDNQKNHP